MSDSELTEGLHRGCSFFRQPLSRLAATAPRPGSLLVQCKHIVQCRTPRGAIVSMGLRGGAGRPKGRNRNLPWPPCKKVIKKLICFLFISTPHPTRFLQIIRILHRLFIRRHVIRAGVAALHVRRDRPCAGFGEGGDCGLGCGGWTVLSFLHIVLSFLFSISMPQSGKIKKIKTPIVQFCKNRYMFMYRFGILAKLVVDGTIVRMVLCRYSKTNGCSNERESDERRRHNADTTDG